VTKDDGQAAIDRERQILESEEMERRPFAPRKPVDDQVELG
jgi:hypothetical protein